MTRNDKKALKVINSIGDGEVSTQALAALTGLTEEQAERITDRLEERGLVYVRVFYLTRYISARQKLKEMVAFGQLQLA